MKEKIYYGSTTDIKRRFNEHKCNYKNKQRTCSCVILFEKYGINNCQSNIVE
jgi:predicted GIY-YIG superfamily endonuclease